MVLLACSPAQQGSCRPRDKGRICYGKRRGLNPDRVRQTKERARAYAGLSSHSACAGAPLNSPVCPWLCSLLL